MPSYRRLCPLLLLFAALPFAAACGNASLEDLQRQAESQGFDNFRTAVASDREYDIYWLGREFEAGGLVFRGPDAGDLRDPDYRQSLAMFYLAEDYENGRGGDIELTLYSEAAWAADARRRALEDNAVSRDVLILGHAGTLSTRWRDGAPSRHVLTLRMGRTVVEAITRAQVPPSGSRVQPNPLMDEDLFLEVMEQLRPYEEPPDP